MKTYTKFIFLTFALANCSRESAKQIEDALQFRIAAGIESEENMSSEIQTLSSELSAITFKRKSSLNVVSTVLIDQKKKRIFLWINHLANGHEVLIPTNDKANLNISILEDAGRQSLKLSRVIEDRSGDFFGVIYDAAGEVVIRKKLTRLSQENKKL